MGVLGTNEEGCLQSNINYFKDYVDSGRKIARGNLFIHTLSSTPLSETAIAFGCQGPVVYMTFKGNHTALILDQADAMISRGEASELLVVSSAREAAICFVLRQKDDNHVEKICLLEEAIALAENVSNLDELIREFIHNLR